MIAGEKIDKTLSLYPRWDRVKALFSPVVVGCLGHSSEGTGSCSLGLLLRISMYLQFHQCFMMTFLTHCDSQACKARRTVS
jgi:hypothetical protein